MKNKAKLRTLEETGPLRRVFIKNENTPLVREENDRLYTKMKELKENAKGSRITKGKLMEGTNVLDEFNINNSIF